MENVVTKGAKSADPMPKLSLTTPGQTGSYEDLGGPTPENSKPDDDSNKLKTPGTTLKQVKDIVSKGAKPADPMPAGMKEEEEVEGDVVAETEVSEDEVVSEEEATETEETQEVVAEEEATEEETEEEIVEEEEIDIEADVKALLEGEELSEEFQNKAKTIFEAAINSKVAKIQEEIEAENEKRIVEEITEVKEALVERVDSYLEYVADEWLKDNKLSVEHGLKSEMTESFLTGMKTLFEEHYVSIPEEKYDVVENMVDKLDEMETKLNEQIERNVGLNKRLAESTADVIVSEVSEGLAATQKEKLASLAESVEFKSEESYREKLETLKESYFGQSVQKQTSETVLNEETQAVEYTGAMAQYMKALNSVKK